MKLKKTIAAALILGVAAFYVVQDGALITSDEPYLSLFNPQIPTNSEINICYIETSFSNTPKGLIYAGGSLKYKQKVSHMAVYIEHPKGNFMFDTGLGTEIDSQFEVVPAIPKLLLSFEKKAPAVEILKRNNISIETIFLSHLHWDHASGIKDFPNAKIVTTRSEHDFALSRKAEPPGFIASQYDGKNINWEFMNFYSGAYEIFDRSFDLYEDGSIVFVPLAGHTFGSIGMFVNLSKEKRYFFTGDLTWARQGFEIPAEKFLIARKMVDLDAELAREQIYKVSQLLDQKPEIKVVPAHDFESYQEFERLD